MELSAISKSVQSLNRSMQAFVEKFEKVGGLNFTEKQQRLVLAMEFLTRQEERLGNLQRTQIELVEKQGATRAKLAQVERDLYPQSIERSTAFEGSTKTEEIRESRRTTLQNERTSLRALLTQIDSNLQETSEAVREAQQLVQRLRKTYLPQIEKEIFEP
jgi:chromosome segregation ATPase